MALLVFVVELRTLSPELLAQIKKCLLEFANLYALSAHSSSMSSLDDRIGLCYFKQSESSSSVELTVAYSPMERKFELLEFHHAVNHLSSCYSPYLIGRTSLPQDGNLTLILNDETLSSAGSRETKWKVILIGACVDSTPDSTPMIFQNASGRDISVEYVFLKNSSDAFLQDEQRLSQLAKRWFGELKENKGLMAHFDFQESIYPSISRISGRLCNTINCILDEFILCKAHGYHEMHSSTSTKTLLTEESGQCWKDLCEVRSAAIFDVIGKAKLKYLDEGLVIGRPYWVIPSVVSETDSALRECDMNYKLFQRLYHLLKYDGVGLICRSRCNIEILMETAVAHHYILQPCNDERMVLRRLAGAEETLPCPVSPDGNLNTDSDANICLDSVAPMKYTGELGGFHKELNQLIQNSSQLGKRHHACCGSKVGGTIHVDEIYRSELK